MNRSIRSLRPVEATSSVPDAEESVIGAILVHPAMFSEVAAAVTPEHFHNPALRTIFEAMLALHSAARPIDALTVVEQMRVDEVVDRLRAAGGPDYLTELADKVVTVENVSYHAQLIRTEAERRGLRQLGLELKQAAEEGTCEPAELAELFGARLAKVAITSADPKPAPFTAEQIFNSSAFTAPQMTFSSGWPALDALIAGGFKSGQLATVAAVTGAGKTGLVARWALHFAMVLGVPVLWITTELDDAEQVARFAAIAWHLRGAAATPDDFLSGRMSAARGAEVLSGLPIYLLNLDDPTVDPFVAIAEKVEAIRAATGQTPIIVDDYLQAHAHEDEAQRRVSVTNVSTQFRRVARRFNTPVIGISSVSRAYYGKAKKQNECENPIDWLAAAKESGDIEYSSAVFMYLDTSDKVDALGEAPARLVVAKSRRGQRGFVGLRFHGPSGAFREANESLAVMAPESKSAGPSDLSKVVAYLRAHRADPPTKEKLRTAIPGVGVARIDSAIRLGLEEGELIETERESVNARGQVRKRKVFTLPPTTEQEDADAS